jgi:hypothetical protein
VPYIDELLLAPVAGAFALGGRLAAALHHVRPQADLDAHLVHVLLRAEAEGELGATRQVGMTRDVLGMRTTFM